MITVTVGYRRKHALRDNELVDGGRIIPVLTGLNVEQLR